jgi:glycosyltransferase involved in cell wall biosynthesis
LGVTLLFGGNGRLRADVEAAAARESNVHYAGPLSGAEKDRFLERCDAGILPSVWQEPGGPTLVALEWLSVGRPLLTSPRGGMAEALPELAGAVAVEPTAEGITRAVERLLLPDEWHTAVGNARTPVGGQDPERWLDRHEHVYARVLERNRR